MGFIQNDLLSIQESFLRLIVAILFFKFVWFIEFLMDPIKYR